MLVVINSAGPMASSVVGAIVEKYGFLNFPMRKRKLHDYILGKRNLSDTYFKERTAEIIRDFSVPRKCGSVGMIDRIQSTPIVRTDLKKAEEGLKHFMRTEFESLNEMVSSGNDLIKKSIIYKKLGGSKGFIEYTTDIETYSEHELAMLVEGYRECFGEVVFINLTREFVDWINSLLSQLLLKPEAGYGPLLVRLSKIKKRYCNYNRNIDLIGGVKLDFDELFLPNTGKIFEVIEAAIGDERLEGESELAYDLYGNVMSYEKAFTVSDKYQDYLGRWLRGFVTSREKASVSLVDDFGFMLLLYLRKLQYLKMN